MRRFNYTGPVYEDEHYMVKRQEMYEDFKKKIDQGRYFTIFAPRQMGKTTFLEEVVSNINQDDYYLGINIDFERYRPFSEEKFYTTLHREFCKAISTRLSDINCPSGESISREISEEKVIDNDTFFLFVEKLGGLIPDKKLVLLIDEFDAVSIEITGNFLYTLRDMYLKRRREKAFSIYSIGLVGVKNIRELNFGSTSPFNIATQVKLENFTIEQCYELINQYIEETGQEFKEETIEKIYFETGGHPFLVNRLCAILVEDVVRDKTKPLPHKDLQSALDTLLKEHNTNFDSLKNNARKYEEAVKDILFTSKDIEYRPHSEANEKLIMYGIIKEDNGQCEISNPVYKKVLLQYFSPERIESEYLFPNGITPSRFIEGEKINLKSLLIHFKEFVERIGGRLFNIVSSRHKESGGQYLLMSYLDLFIRTLDGYSTIETPSGRGRIDVLLHYQGKRYVIELKIWRGKEYFKKGQRQLIDYLRSESLKEGYMVLFDPREKDFREFKENQILEDEIDGYRILSFLINI
ncbi:MAG: AAA-like domain-containing protein [bacterium]|nr:AAA-like domain-containing protein [bacterium]